MLFSVVTSCALLVSSALSVRAVPTHATLSTRSDVQVPTSARVRVELHHGGTNFLDATGLASLLTHSSSPPASAHQPATFDITVIEHLSWRDTLVSFSSALGPCRISSDESAVFKCGANPDGQEAQWRARLLEDGRWLLLSGEPSFSVNGETGEVSNGLAFEWEAEMYLEPTLEA